MLLKKTNKQTNKISLEATSVLFHKCLKKIPTNQLEDFFTNLDYRPNLIIIFKFTISK